MLKLDDYFNDNAVNYVKNHKDEHIREEYDRYLEFGGVGEARCLGWSLLRNRHTKEDVVYGLGWILKSIDMYEKNEYKIGAYSQLSDNPKEEEKKEYVLSLEGVSSVLLPKLSLINDVLKINAQQFIEPNLEIGLEYLLKAITFDCVSGNALLDLSVAYFDGFFGKPDYEKAQYYLGQAISKDCDDLHPDFVSSYIKAIQKGKSNIK